MTRVERAAQLFQLAFPEAACEAAAKHCGYPGSRRIGIVQNFDPRDPGSTQRRYA
jgi:hypothetical protein